MTYLLRLLVTAALAFILAQVLPGVNVDDYGTALLFAFVLGLLNVFLKPILFILTLPLTLVIFGLFLFIINTITVMPASRWVKGFNIESFDWGLLFSFLTYHHPRPCCSARKTTSGKNNNKQLLC